MLIRFILSNFYSFSETKEFNMLPNTRYKRLEHHKYTVNGFDLLKMSSIYGANGAGKSNLIKCLSMLKGITTQEELPAGIKEKQFKFRSSDEHIPQILAAEFIQNGVAFYYAIEILEGNIKTEELYLSGLGEEKDKLIFERKYGEKGTTRLKFSEEFENDTESKVLKRIIEHNFIKPRKPLLKFLTTLDNPFLNIVKSAIQWFEESLIIIYPDTKPTELVQRIEKDENYINYADVVVGSFNLGVSGLQIEHKKNKNPFRVIYGHAKEEPVNMLEEPAMKMTSFTAITENIKVPERSESVDSDNEFGSRRLKLRHLVKGNESILFDLEDESAGTIRLLNLIPAFEDIVSTQKVYLIDEIERSIHPLLIKELVKKFSDDHQTCGQLIFTTHESNLLDQEFFRQDEIWFAEKNKLGSSDLYSLSDYKEHNTIDIRKGYLNGRYGAVPFLSNLKELNWHKNDYYQEEFSKSPSKP